MGLRWGLENPVEAWFRLIFDGPSMTVQPFSQKSRTPTVAKEFPIGLFDPAEADLELFCNSWSAGFLGERLCAEEAGSEAPVS